jgi:hypothetical protein
MKALGGGVIRGDGTNTPGELLTKYTRIPSALPELSPNCRQFLRRGCNSLMTILMSNWRLLNGLPAVDVRVTGYQGEASEKAERETVLREMEKKAQEERLARQREEFRARREKEWKEKQERERQEEERKGS